MSSIQPAPAAAQQILTWNEWFALPQSQIAVFALAISALGFLVAVFSAVSSARSAGTAKKSLNTSAQSLAINSDTAIAANRALRADFTNAFLIKDKKTFTYVFDVKVTNPATRPNTLVEAQLNLILTDGATLLFDPFPAAQERDENNRLTLPAEMAASNQLVGSISYQIPSEILNGRTIKRLRINFTDSSERVTPIETISITRKNTDEEVSRAGN